MRAFQVKKSISLGVVCFAGNYRGDEIWYQVRAHLAITIQFYDDIVTICQCRAIAGHYIEAVEYATLEWVDWFNHRRLLGSIGNIPPAELEAAYYRQEEGSAVAA